MSEKVYQPWDVPQMPDITITELSNRYPRFVADMVQYYGWKLNEDAVEELKGKLDGTTYRAVLKKTRIVNP